MKWVSWQVLLVFCAARFAIADAPFRRGDANADGNVDISDGVATLGFLFLGRAAPTCSDAADADDSGVLDISDAVFTFSFLFSGGRLMPAPGGADCGADPTPDGLLCSSYSPELEARRCGPDAPGATVAVPPRTIAIYGIRFDNAVADLDLTVHDDGGTCLGGRVPPGCTWTNRTWETNEEYLSVLNAADDGATSYSWRVAGPPDLQQDFTPSIRLVPYIDGSSCADHYSAPECEGRPGGVLELIQFPFPDPDDPWVGDGYRFDSPANYRWARRELIMLVRHAIHETQVKFPGTRPLGIGDICQQDGITPGFDIGLPRHPESTHDQGGNIDLAYYTTLSQDGTLDYNPLRIVCDASGSSNDGSYCIPSAAQTHVVDLPRQAYFLSRLYESPRLRVVGVDRVLAPLIIAEATRQKDLGWISATVLQAFQTKLASGDGWPFHHHHIHVSLSWWVP